MRHLILGPGPLLVLRPFRLEADELGDRPNEVDVAGRAHEFLFETVTLRVGTTLGDIFRLLDASPLLKEIFRREFAQELCAEARKGPIDPRARERALHEGIEFLELYQQWGLDTGTHEYSGTQHLHLRGIGHELDDDVPEEGHKKGERIEWSVSLTPLRELLMLPVRVSPEVRITEDDADAKAFMHEIRRARHSDVTLGQVIHGLLWELSFHGGPEQQLEVSEELRRRAAEVDAGTAELVSGDAIFEPLDRSGCDALFDDLGGPSSREIATALRNIDDDENAAAWFDRAFNGEVVVKVQFRDRTGREFGRPSGLPGAEACTTTPPTRALRVAPRRSLSVFGRTAAKPTKSERD